VVVAIEFGELRVDEVEHEVVCEQLLVGVGETGADEGSSTWNLSAAASMVQRDRSPGAPSCGDRAVSTTRSGAGF
jgi:hypothetical protein